MSASWINKLNEDNSRLYKEDVIKQALEASVLGSENAITFLSFTKACYNPYVVFGVKQIPETFGITDAENPWGEFNSLMCDLAQRRLTGHAARDAIQAISERFDSEEWNIFLRPVLGRDLRVGISDKTINKICKGTDYEVPIFGCQLATNSEGRPEMKGTKRLEPKLDGVRVIMMVQVVDHKNCIVTSFSRNGKAFDNFQHIEEQVSANWLRFIAAESALIGGFILDGEVVGTSFQELMRQARRKSDVQADDSIFHIFDIIPIEDFNRGYWNAPLKKRINILNSLRPAIDTMLNVELLDHIMVDLDLAEGHNQMDRYASDMVSAGYEGIMIKDVTAPYVCKRSTDWMKYKPVYDYDLTVIGVEEGTGKHEGRMGALVCSGIDDDKEITVNVGSGYTDIDRQTYWDNRNEIIGRTAVVLADAITKNQNGDYSLRFPRFKTFRDDK